MFRERAPGIWDEPGKEYAQSSQQKIPPFLTIQVIEKAGLARGPAMATFTALGDLGAGVGPMIMGSILEKTS